MPRQAPGSGSNYTPRQTWTGRPAMSFSNINTLYLPTQGRYIYIDDAPRQISRREANAIRAVAKEFNVTLQGIGPDSKKFREPYTVPGAQNSYARFMSLATVYRPGVGPVVGSNAAITAAANAPGPEEQRGYFDPTLGWVPLGTDPDTGEPYGQPSTATPGSAPMESTSASTAIAPNGQVLSPNAAVAQVKYETAVANARQDILRERERLGLTAPLTALEQRSIDEEAKRRATNATNAFVGGNAANAPMDNLLDPNAVAEFKDGQFLPQYTGYEDMRRLTPDEVANLNWLRASNLDGADSAFAQLLDPKVSKDQKAQILGQVNGMRTAEERSAQTAQDSNSVLAFLGSAWNPLTWGPRAVLGGLEAIGGIYTDYVDPSATWVASALPGGPRTATWDEAQAIPVGDMIGQISGQYAPLVAGTFNRAGTAWARGDYAQAIGEGLQAVNPAGLVTTTAFGAGANLASGADPYNALVGSQYGLSTGEGSDLASMMPWVGTQPNDIYDPAYRKAAFEDNIFGSATSGSIGAGVVLLWDPLNVVGPVGKAVRVSHRLGMGAGMLRGSAREAKVFKAHLDSGQIKYQGFDEARKALDEARLTGDRAVIQRAEDALAQARIIKNKEVRGFGRGTNTLTKFGDWILDPKGGVARTRAEILRHSVIRGMPNAAEFAESLTKVNTFEEYALVMRAQAGDAKAVEFLRVRNAELADEIAYLEVTRSADNVTTAPSDYLTARVKQQKETTNAISEFNRLRGRNTAPADVIAQIDTDMTRLSEAIDAVRSGGELGVDAAARDRLWREADRATDLLHEAVFGKSYSSWDEATRAAYRDLYQALSREKALDYAETGRAVISDAEKARISVRLNQLRRENQAFDMALQSEMGLVGNRVNFGTGRAQVLAKWREAARQTRAERQAFQAGSHGSGFKWVRESFRVGAMSADGNITVWGAVRGTKRAVADAATRPFTYAAMESPSGYIRLKGFEAGQSYREILAVLDNLKFYGQDAGTRARKNALLSRYTRMLNDPSLTGIDVVEKFEKSVLYDMAIAYLKKYGLETDDAVVSRVVGEIGDVYAMYDARRAELIKNIVDDGFWVAEDGTLHASPVIESQLIDSMPMMDFRRAERLTDGFIKEISKYGIERINIGKATGSGAQLQDAVVRASERVSVARAEATVAEEALRALEVLPIDPQAASRLARSGDESALKFTESLAEARDLSKKTATTRKELEKALSESIKKRDEFIAQPGNWDKTKQGFAGTYNYFESLWRAAVLLRVGYPVRNTIDGLARRFAFEASVLPMVEDAFRGTRNAVLNVAEGRNVPLPIGRVRDAVKDRNAARALKKMETEGKIPRRISRWVEQERGRLRSFQENQRSIAQYTMESLQKLRAERASVTADELAQFDATLYEIERNVRLLDSSAADIGKKIAALDTDSPATLIAAYRRSLDRPRRVGQEMVQGVDGRTYWGARSDPNFADILESAASAGETVQATLGLNLNISRGIMRAAKIAGGGRVKIGDPNYYTAMTQIVNNQIRNSLVGRMWLNGATVDEVAAALMDPAQGKKYRDMINRDADRAKAARAEDRAATRDYDTRAESAVADEIDREFGFDPRSVALLETDADRAQALLGSIDVPGYGRLDTIAELATVDGSRTIRITLRGPAIGAPGSLSPVDGGWTNIRWQVAPEGEMALPLKQFPEADLAARQEVPEPTFDVSISGTFFDNFLESVGDLNELSSMSRSGRSVKGTLVWNDLGEMLKYARRVIKSEPKSSPAHKAAQRALGVLEQNESAYKRAARNRGRRTEQTYGTSPGQPLREDVPRITVRRDSLRGVGDGGNLSYRSDVTGEMVTLGSDSRLLSRDELPEVLYHVTTDRVSVDADGMLRVSDGRGGGLGGVEATNNVSLTSDFATAEKIADDLMFSAAVRQAAASGAEPLDIIRMVSDEFWAVAKKYRERTNRFAAPPKQNRRKDLDAELDKILDPLVKRIAEGGELSAKEMEDIFVKGIRKRYFSARARLFEVEDPMIVSTPGKQKLLDATDVKIYEIPRNSIPENAAIIDNGMRAAGEHSEVMVFADIPVGRQAYLPAIEAERMAGYLPPTPDVRPAVGSAAVLAGSPASRKDEALLIQALVDAIREQGLGVRATVLNDGRTISVGLPKVTEAAREEAVARMAERADNIANANRETYSEFRDGVELIHSLNRIENIDDARLHAEWLFSEFDRYIPSQDLRQLLSSGPVRQEQIQSIYATPESRAALPEEIHGSEISAATGGGKDSITGLMEGLRGFTDRVTESGFRKLGTIPEDRLVRLPFMARRYEETLIAGTRVLAEQYPNGAPAWAVDWIIQGARKRAIKDTTDYFYTQPRRTNFGRVMEKFIPFVSAWQNSAMAMSKLIAANPETTLLMGKAWMAPDRMGMTDAEGNVRIPIPSWMLGKTIWLPGVGEVPLAGVYGDEWVYDKKSLYVLPQQVDPIISFKAGPIYQMTASTVFQAGWAGPVVPRSLEIVLDAALGAGSAQKVWDAAILGTFGLDEFGRDEGYTRAAALSDKPFGLDRATPPAAQKVIDVVQASFGNNPNNSRAYAVAYVNIFRDETLKWLRGERDEPKMDEIRDRTNGLFTIRGLTNLIGVTGGPFGSVTPPQADFEGQQLVELYRQIQDVYGYDQADEVFMSMFGDEVLTVVKGSSTKGVAPATNRSLARAEKYQSLITPIAPRVADAGLLGYALSDGSETQEDYSPNARLAQMFRDVPGTSDQMRDSASPQESIIQANVSKGWVAWIQFKESQQAELDARGLSSIQANGAEDLRQDRKTWLTLAENDPTYRDWFSAYNDGFSDWNLQARDFLRTFTGDEEWMNDKQAGANPTDMWGTAQEWTAEREKYRQAFVRAGDNTTARATARDRWAQRSTEIARTNPRFYEFWVRYLDEDDLTNK